MNIWKDNIAHGSWRYGQKRKQRASCLTRLRADGPEIIPPLYGFFLVVVVFLPFIIMHQEVLSLHPYKLHAQHTKPRPTLHLSGFRCAGWLHIARVGGHVAGSGFDRSMRRNGDESRTTLKVDLESHDHGSTSLLGLQLVVQWCWLARMVYLVQGDEDEHRKGIYGLNMYKQLSSRPNMTVTHCDLRHGRVEIVNGIHVCPKSSLRTR